jgi:hypothetical protein
MRELHSGSHEGLRYRDPPIDRVSAGSIDELMPLARRMKRAQMKVMMLNCPGIHP